MCHTGIVGEREISENAFELFLLSSLDEKMNAPHDEVNFLVLVTAKRPLFEPPKVFDEKKGDYISPGATKYVARSRRPRTSTFFYLSVNAYYHHRTNGISGSYF